MMSYERLTHAARGEPAPQELEEFLASEHAADIANFIGGLQPEQAWRVLDLLALDKQADVFSYLTPDFQADLADSAPRGRLAAVVSEMDSDDRADLFNQLTTAQQDALLPALAQAEREDIRRLAAHEEDTAGAIMTSDYATLPESLSATQALQKLRHEAPDKETIYRTYVVDEDRRLVGSVRLQDLITAPSRARVTDVMERKTYAVYTDEDQEEVARKIAHYDVLALPVIDRSDRLVGIVTHDDAFDVIEREATEDFHRIGASKLVLNLREAGICMLYRARIFWLVILVFGNIFSGAGIAYFEETIEAYVALVFFLPLLIDSGGNAGSQAATLMVRALATGDVKINDWGGMIGREVLLAGLMGLTMAVAVAPIGFIRADAQIAMVVSLSMVLIVIVGSIIGMSLPFLLTKLKLDPATASAPLITSVADTTGVLIYFALATAFLFPAL
jgi:magnesium transporter